MRHWIQEVLKPKGLRYEKQETNQNQEKNDNQESSETTQLTCKYSIPHGSETDSGVATLRLMFEVCGDSATRTLQGPTCKEAICENDFKKDVLAVDHHRMQMHAWKYHHAGEGMQCHDDTDI